MKQAIIDHSVIANKKTAAKRNVSYKRNSIIAIGAIIGFALIGVILSAYGLTFGVL